MPDMLIFQVGMLYMLCRLYINISQVYFPFYITHLPNLSKVMFLLTLLLLNERRLSYLCLETFLDTHNFSN